MSGPARLVLLLILAALSASGIVGMLLVNSNWDYLYLALAAMPLLLGIWRHARTR